MTTFVGYAGPGDRDLPRSEIEGYQPVSRIGEIVQNAFVDSLEFETIREKSTNMGDAMPMHHEWATVQPGMVCVSRKKKAAVFRQYVAAESAMPVIACAQCLKEEDHKDFFFAGVARSQSVRVPDDGIGAQTDEFFTMTIGGMVTVLNTSTEPIFPGDAVQWTFHVSDAVQSAVKKQRRVRRVGVRKCGDNEYNNANHIGRALSFAKRGEPFDLLLKQ